MALWIALDLQMKDDPMTCDFIRECRSHDGDRLPNGMVMPSYIVMKKGIGMHEWIRSRKPPPLMGIWMLGELCTQVAILHARGFVHRDIKPQNVLWLQEASSWRVIDFGSTVRAGEVVAPEYTLRFAPPELAIALSKREKVFTAHESADIWAVGVMAYEMITGETLFPPGASAEDMKAILTGQQPFAHEVSPELMSKLGRLRRVVQSMLSRNPSERPSILHISRKLDDMAMATGATTGCYKNRTSSVTRL